MKLPTLNVDVAVNTSTLKKDVERANKQLSGIGGKGLAFAGGQFGKVGSLAGLGGGAGAAAVGVGGIGLAIAAPIAAASKIVDAFRTTMQDADKALMEFAKTGKTASGMTAAQAALLREKGIESGVGTRQGMGIWDSLKSGFFSTGGGQAVAQWGENTMKGASWLASVIGGGVGAIGGGTSVSDIMRQADLSIAGSEQEARQLLTRDELKELDSTMRNFARQQREATT